MSLEEVILSILSLGLGDPYEFLAEALSPPSEAAIQNALRFLDSLDAVFLENRDEVGPKGGAKLVSHITPLGYHLAALPLNPRTGKLLLTSCLMGCINPMLTIAAASSVKNIFISPFEKREEADESKLNFMLGESDLLTYSTLTRRTGTPVGILESNLTPKWMLSVVATFYLTSIFSSWTRCVLSF